MASGSEPIECQALVLRVSIHCEGCKKKVKKVLQHVPGVFRCDVDARSNKVIVTTSRNMDANILVAKLRKSGKQAEPWPEEPKQQQQPPPPPAESQSQETKNQNDESSKPSDQPAEKPSPDNAEGSAAEPNNPQPSPELKKSTDETPKPAQEVQDTSNAKANTDANPNGNASDETKAGQQPSEPKGKAKQYQERPIDARVTMEYGGGSHVNYMPQPQPVPVMSYNVARPTASAAYYAAPPAPAPMSMPMPMARPGPSSQGYIDEEYSPSYYNRSSPYEPYYYPQPSPYRYQHYQQSSADDYYYGAPQRRSAFSPPRDAYGEMFNDENANSCSVM